MRYLVTGKEMKFLDQNTSESFHVPELVLMEQAAMAFVRNLFLLMDKIDTALVVCGSGNNGADGLAIARLLHESGVKVSVYLAGEIAGLHTTTSYEIQKKICTSYQLEVIKELPSKNDSGFSVIVDAVFGIGLSRNITGILADIINRMNELRGRKTAVDIASGVDANNGTLLGTAFRADDTITFSFGKVGQYLWPGNEYSGEVHVVPMGITMASWLDKKPRIAVLEDTDLDLLPERRSHSNKGTYGKLLLIAGSVNMAGAAILSAKAAYRAGCGLVKVLTPEENRSVLQAAVPEAVLSTYGTRMDEQQMVEELKWADAVVLGPGIGTGKTAQMIVKMVLQNCAVPYVFDADALNIIAMQPKMLLCPHTDLIVTPHLGEMARLTGDTVALIQTRLMECAESFAQTYDVICVLKDFHTVTAIPYGLTYVNLSGNNGMATAGSGDVLAGIIGSLLAQGMEARLAAPMAVYLHGLAGDAAKIRCGTRSLMASDIIDGLNNISGT